MDHNEYLALRAKVTMANRYLDQVMAYRGKVDLYDILKVVPRGMRDKVVIVESDVAKEDGMGFVRIKQAV